MIQQQSVEFLTDEISKLMSDIKAGQTTPKASCIGKKFAELRQLSQPLYEKLTTEYKPIAEEYFTQHPNQKSKKKYSEADRKHIIERDLQMIEQSLELGEDDFDENGNIKESKKQAIERKANSVIHNRPLKVKPVKQPKDPKDRDRSLYKFNGEEYGKGPLVLALIKHHVDKTITIGHDQLKRQFPDDLLKSYGIFKRHVEALEISKVRKRYFLKESQLIKLTDCSVAICNQFTSDNIVGFLQAARKLGYVIE